jgi:hypothetical protein
MSYVYRQFPESSLIKSVSLRSGEDNTGLSTLHVKMRSTGRVYEYRLGGRRLETFINESFWGGDVARAFRRNIAGQVKSTLIND